MTPQEFESYLKKGNIPSVCFLFGDEQFLVERAVSMLLERAVDPSLKDFNFNVYFGNESRGIDIIDSAQTMPMFSDRRAVLVKRAEQLKAEALEDMIPYIQNPAPGTCLLLTGTKVDQRKKFFLELKKHGVLVEYKKYYEDKLPGFIQTEAVAHGKPIETAAAELLAMCVGNNLSELSAQIEKLVVYAGSKARITVEDVRTMASSSKAFTAFELSRYLGLRDLSNSIRSLDALFLTEREPGPIITGAVSQHFRQLWRVRELLDNKVPQTEIAKAAKINPFFIKDYLQEAKNFGRKELQRIFDELYRRDVTSKTGGDPYTLMHGLSMGICTGLWGDHI